MQSNLNKTLFILIISLLPLFAQNGSGKISGFIYDSESRKPVPLVNVVLMKDADSTTVTGTTTDKNGNFTITRIADGSYSIKCSSIGYLDTLITNIQLSAAKRNVQIENLAVTPTVLGIDEVIVTAKKEMFTNTVDRKVYNLENDIMSKSGTAGDLLQNIPSVSVDIEGNVSLRGSQNVMILINGKSSALMDKNSATVLEELPANAIERIEVITNPSANFKPDGASGIINIVLKKNASLGFNGNITANVGNKNRYNGNVNFNYNPDDFNITGNYSYRHANQNRLGSVNREQTASDGTKKFYNETSNMHGAPLVHMLSFGAEYEPAKDSKFGLDASFINEDVMRTGYTTQVTANSSRTVTEDYVRTRNSPELEKEYEIGLNYEKNFMGEDHQLTLEFKKSQTNQNEENRYSNTFNTPVLPISYDKSDIYELDKSHELNIRYSRPLSEKSSIETGLSGELSNNDIDLRVKYIEEQSGKYVVDTNKTSHFKDIESLVSFYTTYKNEIYNFGFRAGMRIEQAMLKPELVSQNKSFTNEYFNIFPTIHLQYKMDNNAILQLNYSKRVNRPRDEELNPFPEYQDPRNIRSGNPHLLPEFIHSVEFGLQLQNDQFSFIPSVYYRYTTNRFTQITEAINDTVLLTSPKNLLNDRAGGLELVLTASFSKLFNAQLNLNGFYNQINASNLGYTAKASAYSWSGNFSMNFSLPTSTMCQINANYRSVRLTPQGKTSPAYVVNLGLKQDLFEERATLTFTVSDIFNTMRFKNVLNTPEIYDYSVRHRDQGVMYLGLTYHFGKSEKKKDKIEYDNNI